MLSKQEITYTEKASNKSYDFYQLWQANDQEIETLTKQFNIPDDFLTSGQDSYELARFETYTNTEGERFLLCVFNYPYKEQTTDFRDVYQTRPISIVIKDGLVIASSIDSIQALNALTSEHIVIESCDELGLLLNLMWFISRLYIILLEEIDQEIRTLEMDVTESTRNEIFLSLIKLNKALVYFKSSIDYNQEVLNFLREELDELKVEDMDYHRLRDVKVEFHQASGMANQLMQLNTKVSDMLSSVVNNNMNEIMKVLTVWSILLTIPTIISGAWGMNVPVLGEKSSPSFIIICLLTVIVMAIGYWLFKRNKWL